MDKNLENCRVAVFGSGCVGGYAAETLACVGIRHIDLIDDGRMPLPNPHCCVEKSRKLAGMYKAEAEKRRILEMRPETDARAINSVSIEGTIRQFDFDAYDCVLDSLGDIQEKFLLFSESVRHRIPLVSCMDTGYRVNPAALRTGSLAFAAKESLMAQILMEKIRFLESPGGFRETFMESVTNDMNNLYIVYSREMPDGLKDGLMATDCLHCACPPHIARHCTQRRDSTTCNAYVTAMAGMLLASGLMSILFGIQEAGNVIL